jgi:hypothetical protein
MTNRNYNLANYLLNEVVAAADPDLEKRKSAAELLGLFGDMFDYYHAEIKKGRDANEVLSSKEYEKMVTNLRKKQDAHEAKYWTK